MQGSAGTTLPSQTLDISNSGNGSLKWSIAPPAVSWVSVSPTSGVQRGSSHRELSVIIILGLRHISNIVDREREQWKCRRCEHRRANLWGTALPPPPPPAPTGSTLYVTCPANKSVTSLDGGPVVVNYTATTDGGVAPISVTGNPASGSAFPVGTDIRQR